MAVERDARQEQAIDRFWDDLVQGRSLNVAAEPERSLSAAIQRLHALDDRPAPADRFVAQLRGRLLATAPPTPGAGAASMPAAPPRLRPRLAFPAPNHGAWAALAAAALVLLTLAGSLLALRGQRGPNLAPGVIDDTTLLRGTFPVLPKYASWAGIDQTTLAPGATWIAGTRDATGIGPMLYLVEAGTLTMQADGPLTFTRAGSIGDATKLPGETVALRPGDRMFTPSGVASQWRNDGAETTVVLGVGITTDSALKQPANVDHRSLIDEGLITPPVAPVVVAARRITVQAGATVPIATWPGLQMLSVESGRIEVSTPGKAGSPPLTVTLATAADPFFGPDMVLRNVGGQPATLLAMTIQPADPLAVPPA
ncbi:MAG TPA: hypothetical protein VFU81_10360 [Thermomicrobiales bacterium]|nr:hypothetical protein [Thermomicrobiales bacterium]